MADEIINLSDVKRLVDNFYGKVRQDPLLATVFDDVIGNRWPEHLEKMYRFWQTVLLGEHTYQGTPFAPHAHLPVDASHFNRWIELFNQTVDELFTGEKSEEAKWRASKMAAMFQLKIEYYRNHSGAILL